MDTDLEFFERLMREQELKMKDNTTINESVNNNVNPLQIKINKVIIEKRDNKRKIKMVFE